jgi:aryl-alcohol dehydrogenase-like predicted oxidoreductase
MSHACEQQRVECMPPRGRDRLVLGTAQLGMAYGVANGSGRPDDATARTLVGTAFRGGITAFDTAVAYGNSESVLGAAFTSLGIADRVEVISKGFCGGAHGPTLTDQVAESRARLGVPRLSGWLMHNESQLPQWTPKVRAEADHLCAEGNVRRFGVSVYHPPEGLRAVEELGMQIVQFPASPFDRRFLRSGAAHRIGSTGAHLYVRSIFLQGLALMDPASVPDGIPHAAEAVRTLRDFCAVRGFAIDHFCLSYVLQRTATARIVIGLESERQLRRNLEIADLPAIDPAALDAWDATWPADLDDLVLPYRWNIKR